MVTKTDSFNIGRVIEEDSKYAQTQCTSRFKQSDSERSEPLRTTSHQTAFPLVGVLSLSWFRMYAVMQQRNQQVWS
jgi:hypothetical protein